MVGWHHQLNGHEFEQALGVGDGQGSLVCCSPWGRKESDTTERLNWTELNCQSQWCTRSPPTRPGERVLVSYALTVLNEGVDSCAFSRAWLKLLCYNVVLFWERNENNIKSMWSSLWRLSTVKQRSGKQCVCVCVWMCEAGNLSYNGLLFFIKAKSLRWWFLSSTKKEGEIKNFMHSSLSFEWAGNLCACMSLWLLGRVMMEPISFFFFSSHALHIVIHTMNRVPLLAWCENRAQSPIASYNKFMSFFYLWKVFICVFGFSQHHRV